MKENDGIELTEVVISNVSLVQEQYYYLLSHIDALVVYLHEEAQLYANVFVLPKPTVKDVGNNKIILDVHNVKGREAVDRALNHFTDHKLKTGQAGVMANRLPGVLHVKVTDENEVLFRIDKINLEKDKLMMLIRSAYVSMSEQFLLTKAAIPYAIRKSIGRHIHIYPQGRLSSVSFSVSKRSSMSKVMPRKHWLEKLERSRKYVMSRKDGDTTSWEDQIDIEQKVLSQLPEQAQLRIVRPLRKSPIVNLLYSDGAKASQIAHSPIIIVNDKGVKLNPMKSYSVESKAVSIKEAVIPRWHLYEAGQVVR